MIGLIVIGLCIVTGVNRFRSFDRIVSVKGLCEKEVAADKVIWPIAYKILGNDLISLYQQINTNNAVIIEFLKENGINAEQISVSAPEIVDMQANQYSENRSPFRYNVTSVVTVSSDQVKNIRACINKQTELLKKGIALYSDDYRFKVAYSYNALNEIKPAMIEEATKNARAAAEKFAKDSKSKLGKIKNANQGLFSVTDRDMNTPYIKNVRVVTSIDYYLR